MKKQRGITLIALIITIIIMIVLVTITLTIALGENGIISNAKRTKQEQDDAEFIENIQMIALKYYDYLNGGYDFIEMEKEIEDKYPEATMFYSIMEDENSKEYTPIGEANSQIVELSLPIAIQNGKKHLIACTVTKGSATVTIADGSITEGDNVNKNWISHEEAQKIYAISNITDNEYSAELTMYLGNDTNVKIHPNIMKENGAIYGFSNIGYEAFRSYSEDELDDEKTRFRDLLLGFYMDANSSANQDEVTIENLCNMLNTNPDADISEQLKSYGEAIKNDEGKENDENYTLTKDLKIMTEDENEIARLNPIFIELFEKMLGPGYVMENNEVCLYTYDGNPVQANSINRQIETIVIPKTITTIDVGAFKNNKNLTSVTIESETIKSFSTSAFEGCENLNEIIFTNLTVDQVKNISGYEKAWTRNLEDGMKVIIKCSDGDIEIGN